MSEAKQEIVSLDPQTLARNVRRFSPKKVTIDQEREKNALALLVGGISKYLYIIWRPFGGNKLYFYNEHYHLIRSVLELYDAEEIYFTNQFREFGQTELEGTLLWEGDITITGTPNLMTSLGMIYQGGQYTFRDEASFALWNHPAARFVRAEARIN